MRIAFAIAVFGAVTLSPIVHAEVNSGPVVEEYSREGFTYRKVTLKGSNGSLTFVAPRGWQVSGGARGTRLNPAKENFAEGVIEATPTEGPQRFDPATLAALEERALREVPPASQGVEIVTRSENPVLIDNNLSYEFVVSYQTLGHTFHRSTIFVLMPQSQLVFRFSAPKDDFERLNLLFRSSMTSCQWVPVAAQAAKS